MYINKKKIYKNLAGSTHLLLFFFFSALFLSLHGAESIESERALTRDELAVEKSLEENCEDPDASKYRCFYSNNIRGGGQGKYLLSPFIELRLERFCTLPLDSLEILGS